MGMGMISFICCCTYMRVPNPILIDAKIFDFGLVKELQPKDKTGVDEYRLSGKTGTRRYMVCLIIKII